MALERLSRPKLFIIFLSYHQITCEVDLKFPQVVDMTRKRKAFKNHAMHTLDAQQHYLYILFVY